jgi:hypothetical protein
MTRRPAEASEDRPAGLPYRELARRLAEASEEATVADRPAGLPYREMARRPAEAYEDRPAGLPYREVARSPGTTEDYRDRADVVQTIRDSAVKYATEMDQAIELGKGGR